MSVYKDLHNRKDIREQRQGTIPFMVLLFIKDVPTFLSTILHLFG